MRCPGRGDTATCRTNGTEERRIEMTITDFIKQGEDLKASINGVRLGKADEYNIWAETVLRFLNKTVPGDMAIDRFQEQINQFNPRYCYKDEFDCILSVLKGVEAIPSKTVDTSSQAKKVGKGIEINNTLSQNQEQNQKQSQEVSLLVDLLKNSLAPYQLEELKEVAKADMSVSEKRQTLMDKILSFGSNVGASVLANILTNPAVFSCL